MISNAPGRVTLKDIALRCGYTANTVSRALRNDERLPADTRRAIQKLAREMGYVPNDSARALRYGSSHAVAVIINDISNPYYANMLSQIDLLLKEKNYRTVILCTQLDEQLASEMIQMAASQRVDGILFFPFNNAQHVRELQATSIPFVLMDRWIPNVEADIARIDDFAGGYTLAKRMLDLGHRRILYMAGPFVNSSQIDRQNGIMQALEEAGLREKDCLRIVPWDTLPSCAEPADIMALLQPFDYTGILAFNDVLAYHCLTALAAAGMRVPEDMSVAGFDHIRWKNTYLPPLDSIAPEAQGVASKAIELLFDRIENPAIAFRHHVLPVRLHQDGTTAPLRSPDVTQGASLS